jgi:ElaB/YqjD/DUF883 family membrane-anchored ribosome-binding protein
MKKQIKSTLLALLVSIFIFLQPTLRLGPVFAEDEKKELPKQQPKQLTKEEKKALEDKKKDEKSNGTMLKRAQQKIDDYVKEESFTVVRVNVFYGRDIQEGDRDVKVFAEFSDGSLGLYYASVDPDNDTWMYFAHESLEDLKDVIERQIRRK